LATADPQLETLVAEAVAAFEAGRLAEARERAARVLERSPRNHQALHVAVLARLHAGNVAEALAFADRLVEHFADDAFAHNTRGAVLYSLGRTDDAIASYARATELDPQYIDAWFNLARACGEAGRDAQAAQAHEHVVAAGERAVSPYMRGVALLETGRIREGAAALERAVQLDPNSGAAQAYLSAAAHRLGAHDTALASGRAALRLMPSSNGALAAAAQAELQAGDLDAALEGFARLEKMPDGDRWRFMSAIAWPPIVDSHAQIAARRESSERALDALIAQPARLTDPRREVGMTSFYASYQGFDDTALQAKLAQAYRLACPRLEWTAPHVGRPRDASRRIRLGLLSSYLRNHTIGRLNLGIAQHLDRKRFEIVVLRPEGEPDSVSRSFDGLADGGAVALAHDLEAARRKVAECELDALFFPDIGMDAFTYYLAFARLARLQFTTWGHPVTSGIPNMDFFVSSLHAEPEAQSQRYYTEKLAVFRHPTPYHLRPPPPSGFDPRGFLKLGPGERLYVCAQPLFKVHPDFDDALADILQRDAGARIVLIGSAHRAWNEKLYRRLQRRAGDLVRRIDFISPLSQPDFLAFVGKADALLDTFHFGGGMSSYECFAMEAPVVTLPGEMMRGRLTLALYREMGVERWIARSREHFVELALELAHGERRTPWREEIRAGADRLTGKNDVVREFEAFIEAQLATR
jgi:predicted O-linked N-acetylglucosamine transferase (SPINDLY family)